LGHGIEGEVGAEQGGHTSGVNPPGGERPELGCDPIHLAVPRFAVVVQEALDLLHGGAERSAKGVPLSRQGLEGKLHAIVRRHTCPAPH
jgi:hypothetical protein